MCDTHNSGQLPLQIKACASQSLSLQKTFTLHLLCCYMLSMCACDDLVLFTYYSSIEMDPPNQQSVAASVAILVCKPDGILGSPV